MRIIIRSVGKAAAGEEGALAARYLKRAEQFGRSFGVTKVDIREIAESRARSAAERKMAEAALLAPEAGSRQVLVALDQSGRNLSSEAFAGLLGQWREAGKESVTFVIGGADGLAPGLITAADHVLSLGAATWPHLLARAMLLEQIYRAFTILTGHPYHRA